MLINKIFSLLGIKIHNWQILAQTGEFNNVFLIKLTQLLYNTPLGPKVIHYPYHLNFHKYRLKTEGNFQSLKELSQVKILYITQDINNTSSEFLQALTNHAKSVQLKNINYWGNLSELLNYDCLFVDEVGLNLKVIKFIRYAMANNLPTLAIIHNQEEAIDKKATFLATDFLITTLLDKYQIYSNKRSNVFYLQPENCQTELPKLFSSAINQYKKRYFPQVSVLAVIPEKIDDLENLVKFYLQQTYEGESELILISKFPQNQTDIKNIFNKFQVNNSKNKYQLLDLNSFFQQSEKITGSLVILSNSTSLSNYDLLKSHVIAHSFEDCDVSTSCWKFQDEINQSSFLNLNIYSLGIKNELFNKYINLNLLFNNLSLAFKNIDIGYQLYQKGVNIKFISLDTTINTTTVIEDKMSLKELRLLLEKYPDLITVARKWVLMTYETLKHQDNETSIYLHHLLNINLSHCLSLVYSSSKRLKILTYRWHIPHQYELYKLPHDFTLVTDAGTWATIGWDLQQRPIPENVTFKSIRQINFEDFDLAILHFDQNVLTPENTNEVISPDGGTTFKYFREQIPLPKVAICHGTPQFYGQFNPNYHQSNLMKVIEEERKKMVDYVGDILTITNSYEAQKEWKFNNSKVIWHGFDPLDFPPTTYAKGILAPFGHKAIVRPHYQGYNIFKKVFQDFPQEFTPNTLDVREPHLLYLGNQYAKTRFINYVNDIRQYSIYFNPTTRSPMPRSRDEAMMCGLTTVSLKNNDVDLFIDNGVNGFYADNATELREILLFLLENPEENQKIGTKGRALAMDIFNYDRYLKVWQQTLEELLENK